ncbi:MAG TPA: dihydrodipicolinate synthase family protein [Casimicrobiaceae bacterium]|nr:dihydrodipicolinate synthase family protein [Casimicrobiaceae bacterium]
MTAVLLTRSTLEGFVPAIVTPFRSDGSIDESAFQSIVGWLIDLRATAICVAGDNGESWNLDVDERARLTTLAVDAAARRIPIIAGVSAPSAKQTIAYARAVVDAGADGLLVLPQPYVLKATRDELVRRFDALARTVSVPIVAYNSPRRSGIELSLDDLDAILNVAPLVGIKEASRDFFHHTHLIERFRERLAIMIGPCHFILPGLALGAHGYIATGPELLGDLASQLPEIARAAPDARYARAHNQLTTLYEMLMSTGTWPSALKAALNLLGQPAGVPREPVMPLRGAELDKVASTMRACGLIA